MEKLWTLTGEVPASKPTSVILHHFCILHTIKASFLLSSIDFVQMSCDNFSVFILLCC